MLADRFGKVYPPEIFELFNLLFKMCRFLETGPLAFQSLAAPRVPAESALATDTRGGTVPALPASFCERVQLRLSFTRA